MTKPSSAKRRVSWQWRMAVLVRHADAVREDHDRTAKTVTAAPALDEARANPSLIDTYESDDTFAHTELMKARGGRLDLIV